MAYILCMLRLKNDNVSNFSVERLTFSQNVAFSFSWDQQQLWAIEPNKMQTTATPYIFSAMYECSWTTSLLIAVDVSVVHTLYTIDIDQWQKPQFST